MSILVPWIVLDSTCARMYLITYNTLNYTDMYVGVLIYHMFYDYVARNRRASVDDGDDDDCCSYWLQVVEDCHDRLLDSHHIQST